MSTFNPTTMFLSLQLTLLLLLLTTVKTTSSSSDYTTLVYKGCSKQTIPDPTPAFTTTLTSLTTTLISQSSKTKYYKTTLQQLTAMYQCRGDTSSTDCYNCVSKLPTIISTQCPPYVASARVQLMGCAMSYEVTTFAQVSGLEMLYKVCSATNVAGSGFEMRRDTALQVMENGVVAGGGGFYKTTYQGVYVMGQCEGDLSVGDCGVCVRSAVQKGQVECGSSLGGEIYLLKCFISYGYFPNGVPTRSLGFGGGGGSGGGGSGGGSYSGNAGKTVAIIVGATFGLGFLVILALFFRGLKKKDDDY